MRGKISFSISTPYRFASHFRTHFEQASESRKNASELSASTNLSQQAPTIIARIFSSEHRIASEFLRMSYHEDDINMMSCDYRFQSMKISIPFREASIIEMKSSFPKFSIFLDFLLKKSEAARHSVSQKNRRHLNKSIKYISINRPVDLINQPTYIVTR